MIVKVIRYILTAGFIIGVYTETGWFTALSLSGIFIGLEYQSSLNKLFGKTNAETIKGLTVQNVINKEIDLSINSLINVLKVHKKFHEDQRKD